MSAAPRCPLCGKGAEVCMYCASLDYRDWEAICDCGLASHDRHLIACDIVTDEDAHSERAFADEEAVRKEHEA